MIQNIIPNAHYDAIDEQPQPIEIDNDGSYLYRFNITPIIDDDKIIGYECYEVRCWGVIDKNNIKKTVIRSLHDECEEFSIINSYNRHVLGIVTDESAVTRYRDYLRQILDIDEQITIDTQNY